WKVFFRFERPSLRHAVERVGVAGVSGATLGIRRAELHGWTRALVPSAALCDRRTTSTDGAIRRVGAHVGDRSAAGRQTAHLSGGTPERSGAAHRAIEDRRSVAIRLRASTGCGIRRRPATHSGVRGGAAAAAGSAAAGSAAAGLARSAPDTRAPAAGSAGAAGGGAAASAPRAAGGGAAASRP